MTIQVNITQHARYLIALISVFTLATACSKSNTHSNAVREAKPPMEALVSTEWLSEHLEDPDLVVLDSTVLIDIGEDGSFNILSGRASYESGHIPSAGFADLMGNLSDPERPAQFIMPTAEQFAAAMGALGVGDDSQVVLYTANNPDWAARVWWMLRWIGFDQVAMLDGGLSAWVAEDRPLSTKESDRRAKLLSVTLRPELIADRDQVFAPNSLRTATRYLRQSKIPTSISSMRWATPIIVANSPCTADLAISPAPRISPPPIFLMKPASTGISTNWK